MTAVRQAGAVAALLLCSTLLGMPAAGLAQTPLTLEDVTARAQRQTADARALTPSVDEAETCLAGARSGFWPRVDVIEQSIFNAGLTRLDAQGLAISLMAGEVASP